MSLCHFCLVWEPVTCSQPSLLLQLNLNIFDLRFQVLRKLRKLAWTENEPYLVRVFLKAVKGRFSQVPQIASLASGRSRYHPSLGVAFVDALLEEVSHNNPRHIPLHSTLLLLLSLQIWAVLKGL